MRRYRCPFRVIGSLSRSHSHWPSPSGPLVRWSVTNAESAVFYYYSVATTRDPQRTHFQRKKVGHDVSRNLNCHSTPHGFWTFHFVPLYLRNELIYQRETKCVLWSTFSVIKRVAFVPIFFTFSGQIFLPQLTFC